MSSAIAEAQTGEQEIEGTQSGPDADKGQLFEVPRVAITIDDSDPNILKLDFSGSIEIDRTVKDDADFYNTLVAGRDADLTITAFVKGAKTTHRRDGEGNVDAVVQTKTLIVHSIEAD